MMKLHQHLGNLAMWCPPRKAMVASAKAVCPIPHPPKTLSFPVKVILTAVSQQACVCTNYGMAITGFQAEDLLLFESIVGIEVSCVIVIDCTKEVLLNRVLPVEVTGTCPVQWVRKR